MDPNNNINELKEIYNLSANNPKWLMTNINRVKEFKLNNKEMPKDLIALAKYVHSSEFLQKRGFPEYVLLDEYFLSYATPIKFAEHRTNKIKELYPNKSLIDICCGSGLQLIEFCKAEIKSAGIEKDEQRYYLAKININLAHFNKNIKVKPEIYLDDALSENSKQIVKYFNIIFCDSFRKDKIYSPNLNEVYDAYKTKQIIYEFIPTENIKDILDNYSMLKNNSEIEFYGEKDRCSRLTAYICNKDLVDFCQNDDYLDLQLNYKHKDLQGNKLAKFSDKFPEKEFIVLNKCIIENYFTNSLPNKVFILDKRRYLLEINEKDSKKFKKKHSSLMSAESMHKIESYLRQNYNEDYNLTLRFEIDPKEYWNFINKNNLKTVKESKNKLSLFNYNNKYYLCLEK